MLKKIIYIFLVGMSGIFHGNHQIVATELPKKFSITEKVSSWDTTFDIKTKEELLGKVHRTLFTMTPEYHLKNSNDEVLAKAKLRIWSVGIIFDVQDSQGYSLGTVNEKLSWMFPTFEIISPASEKLAKAKLNFWKTKWKIVSSESGHTIAVLSRRLFKFNNHWKVKISDPYIISHKKIHPHLFMTMAAFQIDKQYWEDISKSEVKGFRKGLENNENKIYFYLQQELENYRIVLEDAVPNEEDFLFVESLTSDVDFVDDLDSEEVKFYEITSYLFEKLSSDQLTKKQKAALFLMLEERFNY